METPSDEVQLALFTQDFVGVARQEREVAGRGLSEYTLWRAFPSK